MAVAQLWIVRRGLAVCCLHHFEALVFTAALLCWCQNPVFRAFILLIGGFQNIVIWLHEARTIATVTEIPPV